MKNEEKIGHIAIAKRAITSLWLRYKIPPFCWFIIYQGKQKHKNNKIIYNNIYKCNIYIYIYMYMYIYIYIYIIKSFKVIIFCIFSKCWYQQNFRVSCIWNVLFSSLTKFLLIRFYIYITNRIDFVEGVISAPHHHQVITIYAPDAAFGNSGKTVLFSTKKFFWN